MENTEQVYFDKNGLRVTSRLIVLNNSTFVPSSISGVTVDLEKMNGRGKKFLLWIVFAFFSVSSLCSYLSSKEGLWAFLSLMTAFLAVVFFTLWRKKPQKMITLVAAGNHTQTIASKDHAFIDEAIDAIHKVI